MKGCLFDLARAVTVYIVEDRSVASDAAGVHYHLFLTRQGARDYHEYLQGRVIDHAALRMRVAQLTFRRERRGRGRNSR